MRYEVPGPWNGGQDHAGQHFLFMLLINKVIRLIHLVTKCFGVTHALRLAATWPVQFAQFSFEKNEKCAVLQVFTKQDNHVDNITPVLSYQHPTYPYCKIIHRQSSI